MNFVKRHYKLCVLVIAVLLCGIFLALMWSGLFGVPVSSDYHIPDPHYQVSFYQNGSLVARSLDTEKLDEVSAVVRSVKNQKLTFSAEREPEADIYIQWGNLHFYPTCYSNSKWNYTCDNYPAVYEKLKAIAESLPEQLPLSDEEKQLVGAWEGGIADSELMVRYSLGSDRSCSISCTDQAGVMVPPEQLRSYGVLSRLLEADEWAASGSTLFVCFGDKDSENQGGRTYQIEYELLNDTLTLTGVLSGDGLDQSIYPLVLTKVE